MAVKASQLQQVLLVSKTDTENAPVVLQWLAGHQPADKAIHLCRSAQQSVQLQTVTTATYNVRSAMLDKKRKT